MIRTTGIAVAIALSVILPAGSARALPSFAIGYGLDTTNAPFDFADTGNTPVSGGNSRQTTNAFGSLTKSASATVSAEQGRLRVVNQTAVYKVVQPNRVEAIASFSGAIMFCQNPAPPSAGPVPTPYPTIPAACASPSQSFLVTLPDLAATGSFNLSRGDSAGTAYAIASIRVFVNGSQFSGRSISVDADDLSPLFSATVESLAGNQLLPTTQVAVCGTGTPCSVNYQVSIGTITGCTSTPGCRARIDMGNSLNFFEGVDLFGGLPDGISVWSADLNIYDNRWYSPETLANLASVPAPATAPLLLVGLLCVAAVGWRRETTRLLSQAPIGRQFSKSAAVVRAGGGIPRFIEWYRDYHGV